MSSGRLAFIGLGALTAASARDAVVGGRVANAALQLSELQCDPGGNDLDHAAAIDAISRG
jgi:hypothetical protein